MRELDLLQHIYTANPSLGPSVSIPPGDDMGMVRIGDQAVLVAVDQLADGVHVQLGTTSLEKIARKAITRNLSDVAAMAAKPVGAVVAASLPKDFGDERAKQLFDAMRAVAESFACPLIGGDIAMWDQRLLLSVTIFAEPAGIKPVFSKRAQVGDAIYVTGQLGGSLQTLKGPPAYTHHLDFEPRIELARKLAQNPTTRPHCMIDLSDGLAKDIYHIVDAAVIEVEQLPMSEAAQQAAAQSGQPAWAHAAGDGEDYELLFTATPNCLPNEVDGVSITCIGHVTSKGQGIKMMEAGQPVCFENLGWEHRT